MNKREISRQPDIAFWLYIGACLVFAAVTFKVGGLRFPSFTLFVLFLTGGALAWTLDILIRYANDTRRLADIATAQRGLTHRPCVVIAQYHGREALEMTTGAAFAAINAGHPTELGRATMAELPSIIELKNVGLGPALKLEAKKSVGGRQAGMSVFFPHLAPENAPTKWTPRIKNEARGTNWNIEISYLGLSGARFTTRYSLDGELIVDIDPDAIEEAVDGGAHD
jgi:hypothetical protein